MLKENIKKMLTAGFCCRTESAPEFKTPDLLDVDQTLLLPRMLFKAK